MAFEKLTGGIKKAVEGIKKSVIVDKKTVKEYTKEIQKTLLSSDVNVKLVLELSKKIEERGLKEQPPGSLTRRENLIKITYEEIVNLVKSEKKAGISQGSKVLMVGVQGSGKTTTTAKISKYYTKKGYRVGVICADTFRPAAYDQLKQLSESISLPFYGERDEKDALKIIKNGIKKFSDLDIIFIDSEGRHKLDDVLMGDINRIYEQVKPDETLLVLDGTMGQKASEHAEAFKSACNVTGVVLTKLDGSAKGGGALSACSTTNSPVYFMGIGEKIGDFEEFDANRFVSRIIGFGDIEGLIEKAKEIDLDEQVATRMVSGKFDMNDVYNYIKEMKKMGPFNKILEMLPGGMGTKIPKEIASLQEDKLKIYTYIIDSMTPYEREHPEVLKKTRVFRVSKGSGRSIEDVRDLIKYYDRMKKMMKKIGSEKKLERMLKRFGLGGSMGAMGMS